MKLGFIGVGTIASSIVAGLRAAGNLDPIALSPRNPVVAASLADRYVHVHVASTNQAVLDVSDVVVLAVRPQIAAAVMPELRFRADQHVVSLIATLSLDYLRSVTAPAATVTRAVPIPAVARGGGPTAMYPPSEPIKALFDSLGTAIELNHEREFEVYTAATAVMSSYFAFAEVVTSWMTGQGAAPDTARSHVCEMFLGLAETARATPGHSFDALAEEHQTRGGLNEQVLRTLTDVGILEAIEKALDSVLLRLTERGTHNATGHLHR